MKKSILDYAPTLALVLLIGTCLYAFYFHATKPLTFEYSKATVVQKEVHAASNGRGGFSVPVLVVDTGDAVMAVEITKEYGRFLGAETYNRQIIEYSNSIKVGDTVTLIHVTAGKKKECYALLPNEKNTEDDPSITHHLDSDES